MNDTVGDQDIWNGDLGAVDVDAAVDDRDLEFSSAKGLQGGVAGDQSTVDD